MLWMIEVPASYICSTYASVPPNLADRSLYGITVRPPECVYYVAFITKANITLTTLVDAAIFQIPYVHNLAQFLKASTGLRTCIYTCVHTCLCTCLYACLGTCLRTCLHTCPCTFLFIRLYTSLYTRLYTCLHTCLHAHGHVYRHGYTLLWHNSMPIPISTYIIHKSAHMPINTRTHTCLCT